MQRNKRIIGLGLLLVFTTAFVAFRSSDRYFEIARNLEIFAAVYKEINNYYVDEVNPNTLMRTGIDAMLQSLDPYTNYIPEDDIEDFRYETTGQYGGTGIQITKMNGKTMITKVFEGYSAFRAGIIVSDEITKVNGVEISALNLDETGKLMRGQLGNHITLSVLRYGESQARDFSLKIEKITDPNVPYYTMLTDDIGYFLLVGFTFGAGDEAQQAVRNLINKGAKKIILDLRENPGGIVDEAVAITNIFISKGIEVVYTRGKVKDASVNRSFQTRSEPVNLSIPLVILINSGSASASEIVAGTIQDLDRGVIIGEKSYGKGLVQQPRSIPYNSQVKITIAKYYIPSGRSIQSLDYAHRNPDGSVGTVPDSLKTAFLTKNGRTVYDGGGIDPDVEVHSLELSSIGQAMDENGYFFEFAARYKSRHSRIEPPRNFRLADAEFEEFVNWVSEKEYEYTTDLDRELEDLIQSSKYEKYFLSIENQLIDLQETIEINKKSDIHLHKDELKMLLESYIVSMYYPESGIIEANFKHDEVLGKAIDVLENSSEYKSLLSSGK
jgi:carboxyl-terminal processing protease